MKKILVMILAITLILSNVTTMTIHANKSSDKINLHIINYTDTSAIVEVEISDGSNNFKYTMNGSGGSGLFDVDPGFQWKDDGYAVVAFYIGGNLYDSSQYDSTGQGASNFKITLPEPVAQYTIKVVVVGQGTASVNGSSEITVDEGTTLTFLEEAASGWELQGWDVTLPSTATESATYTVTFVEKEVASDPDPVEYTITVAIVGQGTASVNGLASVTVEEGTTLTFLEEAASGWELQGWDVTLPSTATESATYTVTFVEKEVASDPDPVEYTITVAIVGQGTASVNGLASVTVEEGTTLTFIEEAASGWELQGWDVTLPSTATESATYTVTFVEVQEIPDTTPPAGNPDPQDPTTPSTPTTPSKTVQYVLTVSSTEGGTVPGFIGDHTFNSGTHVNLKPVAEEGYEFVGWEGSVSNNIVVMNSDKSVRAIFRLIPTNEDIFDEDIAQGVLVEEVPEVPFEEDLLDMDIPEASPFEEDINDDALPQTGGLPIGVYGVLGTVLAGAGASLKKKNR